MEPIHVLVIEPEQSTREQLKTALQLNGQVELHLSSSAEGAAEMLTRRNEWALIVLNVWLPGRDAFSLIQEWKQRNSKTQFILLSQDASKDELVKALRIGVTDYFEKPFALAELRGASEHAIHKYLEVAPVISIRRDRSPDYRELRAESTESTPSETSQVIYLKNPHLSSDLEESIDLPTTVAATLASYTLMKKKWIESFEVDYLSQLLNHHSGNVSAAARAARLDRSNFLRLLRKYGLKAEAYRAKLAA
jgi:hypothetical protein